jgi:hypothetical protein
MKVFVFNHPVDFPQSEYGGMWVVRAEGPYQAGHCAWEYFDDPDVRVEAFQQAALEGTAMPLHPALPYTEPMVVDCFLT